MDRTILIHQADASGNRDDATLLLVGDSSCLMDVDALALSEQCGENVLNLGTISYIDLPTMGRFVERYHAVNPGRLETVVLLLHPHSLRLAEASAPLIAAVENYLAGRDVPVSIGISAQAFRLLGVEQIRGRLLARTIPQPLPLVFGRFYGFTWDLSRYLESNRGSAVDPHNFVPTSIRGNPEYWLANRFEAESREFRRLAPSDVRLVVGLTPAPASFVGTDHAEVSLRMLTQWAEWLRADFALTELPTTLPDAEFATVTHLTAEGRERFTSLLAAQLTSLSALEGPSD